MKYFHVLHLFVAAFLGLVAMAPAPATVPYPIASLQYKGSFRLPVTPSAGNKTFSFGQGSLAYNPANNSLFITGSALAGYVAEVSIPATPVVGPINTMPVATILQPFADVTGGLVSLGIQSSQSRLAGLMVRNGKLYWDAFIYYDASHAATASHGISSLNLSNPLARGMFTIAGCPPGALAGGMAEIPSDWQPALGYSHLTGQSGLSIITRTSSGPCFAGVNLDTIGGNSCSCTPYAYYPAENPLTPHANPGPANADWTWVSKQAGLAFISKGGQASVLVFSSRGTGIYWYGVATGPDVDVAAGVLGPDSIPGAIPDKWQLGKGNHAPPYELSIYAYDPAQIALVTSGRLKTWQLKPYFVGRCPGVPQSGLGTPGGVAVDVTHNLIYVSDLEADIVGQWKGPLIHVLGY